MQKVEKPEILARLDELIQAFAEAYEPIAARWGLTVETEGFVIDPHNGLFNIGPCEGPEKWSTATKIEFGEQAGELVGNLAEKVDALHAFPLDEIGALVAGAPLVAAYQGEEAADDLIDRIERGGYVKAPD